LAQDKQNRFINRFVARFIVSTVIAGGAIFIIVAGSACTAKKHTDTATQKAEGAVQASPPTWTAKMKLLSETLSDLLPIVTSRAKFSEEKNLARIESDTKQLRQLAHSLSAGSAPNYDPGMAMMMSRFEDDVDRALEGLKTGNRDYARSILRDTTAYCIHCHTASHNGPEFPKLNLNINVAELNPLDRAEFFTATRQFDRALEEYIRVINNEPVAKADPFEWERAARSALAIVVRVKGDPKAAQTLIDAISKNHSAPKSVKDALPAWNKSIHEWMKEKRPLVFSPIEQLELAEKLVAKAERSQEYPLDHSQDILYFRASSLLADLLAKRGRVDETTAKALYLAGQASEATRDMSFWTLHETYYERCIVSHPHSDIARKCWGRLSDSITLGYSGSGGTRIPPEVEAQINKLKATAN
jgi:hypothetical protein